MIPKVIHYCWFGKGELPDEALSCIESWKKNCPDYIIKRWDENNFDVNICQYTKEAYAKKKWAFVSDYARFYILNHYGGIYFDTDVEVLKNIDDIIQNGAFMACEKGNPLYVAPGLGMASEANNGVFEEILEYYDNQRFVDHQGKMNLETVVIKVTKILTDKGFKGNGNIEKVCNMTIYPPDFFCPKDYYTGELNITDNTHCIHHYTATWYEKEELFILKFKQKVRRMLGHKMGTIVSLPIHYLFKLKLRLKLKFKNLVSKK